MAGFADSLRSLENTGLTDVVLPFILIFTIIFAVLEKSKILGEGRKNFNVMVALSISLMVVIPHVMGTYPPGSDVVEIINTAIPNVSVIAIAIIMALILIGVAGFQFNEGSGFLRGLIMIVSLLSVVYFFGASAGLWGSDFMPDFMMDPDTQALIIIVLVFGLIIMFVTAEPNKGGMQIGGNLGKMLGDSLKKL